MTSQFVSILFRTDLSHLVHTHPHRLVYSRRADSYRFDESSQFRSYLVISDKSPNSPPISSTRLFRSCHVMPPRLLMSLRLVSTSRFVPGPYCSLLTSQLFSLRFSPTRLTASVQFDYSLRLDALLLRLYKSCRFVPYRLLASSPIISI